MRRGRCEIFTEIYETNAWKNAESRSGAGSTRARAATFRDDLAMLLKHLRIQALLDAPCGDFNWMVDVVPDVARYIGADIVVEMIEANKRHHGSPSRQFVVADIVSDALPRADLILCRDALVHLTLADIWRTLRNFRRTGATYLLATTFTDHVSNSDIATGEWRVLNMQALPFAFPPPLASIDERCHHTGGVYADKRLALWRLADLLPSRDLSLSDPADGVCVC
jgi:hypothetical protein